MADAIRETEIKNRENRLKQTKSPKALLHIRFRHYTKLHKNGKHSFGISR